MGVYEMRSLSLDLESGMDFSFNAYSGRSNIESFTLYERLVRLKDDKTPLDISNIECTQMMIKKVELVVKERDLEYEIEFCDIFVTGVIL